MNIEQLAKEAGFDAVETSVDGLVYEAESKHLKRFAASVAEECAKLCDEIPAPASCSIDERSLWDIATVAAGDAIREKFGELRCAK